MQINQPKIEGLQKSDSEPAPPLLCLAPVLRSLLDFDFWFSSLLWPDGKGGTICYYIGSCIVKKWLSWNWSPDGRGGVSQAVQCRSPADCSLSGSWVATISVDKTEPFGATTFFSPKIQNPPERALKSSDCRRRSSDVEDARLHHTTCNTYKLGGLFFTPSTQHTWLRKLDDTVTA